MRREFKVAAKNTHWWHFGLRAIYFGDEYGIENSLECSIFHESLMCAHYVRNIVLAELAERGAESLLNHSPEYIIDKYSAEYPELCLILCNLVLAGPLSPIGLWGDSRGSAVNRVFGISPDSLLHNVDFYSENIPMIRIKRCIFTIGTDQPRFSTVADVEKYYRNDARIEEIARMCEFWLAKFYKE